MEDSFIVKFIKNGKKLRMKKSGLLEIFPEYLSNHFLSIPEVHTVTLKTENYGTIIIERE